MKRYTVRPRASPVPELRVGNDVSSRDNVLIARLAEAGPVIPVTFDLHNEHVVAIVGKRGSGKSYTLGSLLEGLCTNPGHSSIGKISGKRATLLFDTLGIFQWSNIALTPKSNQKIVREQYEAHKGWNLETTPLNVLIWQPRTDNSPAVSRHIQFIVRYSDLTASDWGYLLNLDILQDRMGQLLNDAYIKVTLEGWADDNVRSPNIYYNINNLIDCINSDHELQTNYQSETKRAVIQQLTAISRNPLFGQEGTALNELLRPGTMSVIVMNKMSDELRFILITALIRRIMRARIESSEIEKDLAIREDIDASKMAQFKEALASGIPPCWIAADEAQNFLPSEKHTSATDVLVKLVREGRNYGLSFAITTQQPTAIDQRIMSQVDTLVAHKLTVQSDIEYVRKNLKGGLPEEIKYANSVLNFDDVLRSLDIGQAVVSNTETDRMLIVNIRPRISVHGGF